MNDSQEVSEEQIIQFPIRENKITQLTVNEIKKDPNGNTEFVMAFSSSNKWGAVKKITFLAPAGTHCVGDTVQVTIEVRIND